MGCVSPVKFAVILNGHSGNKFAHSRGLRQGDPLSPYLFLLIGEVLFRLIQVAVENKSLDDVKLGVTGPEVNLQKFSVFFGANTLVRVSEELGSILGMPGRIIEKLQGWKNSTLSKAGKEVLIKAVVQAIPAYPMNIFKFPAMVCEELDTLVAGFWWGNMSGDNKIH
ncbi:hypothetical protein FF1_005873 [Malus domestica]